MPSFSQLIVLFLVVLTQSLQVFATTSASGNRVLAVLDAASEADTVYSLFFGALKEKGYTLSIKSASDSFELTAYDELNYDHLLVFSNTSTEYQGDISVDSLMNFVQKGGNLLLAASSEIPEVLRDFTFEFSADFDDQGTAVYDDLHSTQVNGQSAIYSTVVGSKANAILTPGGTPWDQPAKLSPVLFSGVAHRLTGRNPLIVSVLTAHGSGYSFPLAEEGFVVDAASPFLGRHVSLVSAAQTRENARVVFCGSAAVFSDEFAKAKVNGIQSGNAAFSREVAQWVFQEKRVLQMKGARHHREGEVQQKGIYRIKDNMVYEVQLTEFYQGEWHPFHASDVQFEALMLDPYVRKTMVRGKGDDSTKYLAFFKLPDQYGVFKFRVAYSRHGLSWVETSDIVEVRPFRHNEYPRFLLVAYPYYANAFSMIGGFLVISAVWLFHRDGPKKDKAKSQ